MSSDRQIVIKLSELNRISILCGHCATELILDAANAKSEVPENCPSCRTKYDFALKAAFDGYKNVLGILANGGARVRVQE
jgi:uncharacterized CHY-type Zn-finger protein